MPDEPDPLLSAILLLQDVAIVHLGLYGFSLLVLLLLSALISASEVALFSLQQAELEQCRTSGKSADRHLIVLLSKPQRVLATILIVNNVVNITFVTLATSMVWSIFGTHNLEAKVITALTALSTLCIVFFGEIVPKVYASEYALRYARSVSHLLYYTDKVLVPLTAVFDAIHGYLTRRIQHRGYSYSIDSLQQALDIASSDVTTSANEEDMLRGVMNLSYTAVQDVMQPRHTIVHLKKDMDFHQLLDALSTLRYARVPIYEGTPDKIVGILYRKDILPHVQKPANFIWHDLLHPVFFVPENRKIRDVFRDFQTKHVHIAIVVDEYGGTAGLVTMEDIIEEIVGDIQDESDVKNESDYRKVDKYTYLCDAKMALNDFCKLFSLPLTFFDGIRRDSQSLAGIILELRGALPTPGTKVTYKRFSFTILSVDNKRIKTIRVVSPADRVSMAGSALVF